MANAKHQTDGLNLTKDLLDYVRETVVKESEAQIQVRERTSARENSRMMISPEQGSVLAFIATLLRPRRIIEVGVFTGYSALWLEQALLPGGTIVACDVNPDYLEIATEAWHAADLQERIVPRQGPAADTLRELLDAGWGGSVDVIFIDADKTGYLEYYELGKELLRPGGALLFDNVLWGGKVVDPSIDDESTVALRNISAHAAADDEVTSTLITTGDGLLAVCKR